MEYKKKKNKKKETVTLGKESGQSSEGSRKESEKGIYGIQTKIVTLGKLEKGIRRGVEGKVYTEQTRNMKNEKRKESGATEKREDKRKRRNVNRRQNEQRKQRKIK